MADHESPTTPTTARRVTEILFVRIPYLLGGTLILAAIAINFANVVGRYVFFRAIYWAEEVLVFMIIWGVFISAASITFRGEHLRMDLFSAQLRSPAKEIVGGLIAVLMFVSAVFVVFYSVKIVALYISNGATSITTDIPLTVPHAALLVGFSLIALAVLLRMRAYITGQFD